jgi:hypothetical protein
MRWKMLELTVLIAVLLEVSFASEWVSEDLCTICWGWDAEQLAFLEETINVPDNPTDPDDYDIAPATGPNSAMVDMAGNIVVSTFSLGQLKVFSNSGALIFDFSMRQPNYNPEIFREAPEVIYIDSLSRLYVQDAGTRYVPVVDYTGEILERIRPFSQDSNAYVHFMNWSPTGTLFFFNRIYGWVTYSDGQSTAGGSTGFLASNGSFYTAYKKTASSLEFKRFENPDSTTLAESRELTEIPVAVDTLVGAGLLNGGDGNSLYVIMNINDYNTYEIWQFDLDYNFIDSLALPVEEPYQDLRIFPFIRRDGNIYEFRFREDGFHVVRWSKE